MSISTNYDYKRYSQYDSQVSSVDGQQRIHPKKHSQNTDSTQQLLDVVDNSTNSASANKPKNPLDSLVEAGTITSDQEKAIKDALEASRMAFQTQAGASNSSVTFKDPLGSLVSNGTISKDQASAIKSTFDSDKKAHRMPPPPQFQQNGDPAPISKALDGLVKDGEITSNQQETILSALQSAFQSNQTQTSTSVDPLDSLVKSGAITNEQETTVKSAFEAALKAYQNQSYSYQDTFWNSFNKNI